MQPSQARQDFAIHRHIGGLEMVVVKLVLLWNIHRHIGGLERQICKLHQHYHIHRHIGGLEIYLLLSLIA